MSFGTYCRVNFRMMRVRHFRVDMTLGAWVQADEAATQGIN